MSVLIVMALLATNVLTLVSSAAYRLASFAIDTISEGASLRSRSQAELTRLRTDIERSKRQQVKLEDELGKARKERAALKASFDKGKIRIGELRKETSRLEIKMTQIETNLVAETGKSSRLNDQLAEARAIEGRSRLELTKERNRGVIIEAELEAQNTRRAAQVDLIDTRTRRITKRSGELVAREVASMPLESIPWFGIATIVTVTGLELKDLCDTAKDMKVIREAMGLSDPLASGTDEICGAEIWTVSELFAWVTSGEDGQREERCRRLVEELGLPRPEDCPTVQKLPPIPTDLLIQEPSPEPVPPKPESADADLIAPFF